MNATTTLNANMIELITDGGKVAVTKEVFWAEAERRRKERQREKRIMINKAYYQERKSKSVAATSSAEV